MSQFAEPLQAQRVVYERRTCRCCGNSMPYDERKAVDSLFKEGLDVCLDCMPHVFEKSCLG